mmetsp:Transcript_1328/g.3770  ORF Transcript_1328/g.3770 Transcript_1328/m.3770 type:complete len:403 (-) Transcript_1328:187-1395(-)
MMMTMKGIRTSAATSGFCFTMLLGGRRGMAMITTTTRAFASKFHVFYNDVYEVRLPKGHRFPMEKYEKVRRRVQQKLGEHDSTAEAGSEHAAVEHDFIVSPLATVEELSTTHCADYIQRFMNGDITPEEQRNVGFPWSPSGVKRATSSVGGTVAAACAVCENYNPSSSHNDNNHIHWAAHVAGGTHHAFYDRGEGFCVFSDIAVAANVVLQRYPMRRILILDLDVHQGNGNAVLFQNRTDVSTVSVHCDGNYFSQKQKSDLDIELPVGCTDGTYLSTLHHWLTQIRNGIGGKYDLIFFQAGVDILEHDRLGRMQITAEGVQKRNAMVYEFAAAMNVPLVITMGGGYPNTQDWTPILDAHAGVYVQAFEFLNDLVEKRRADSQTAPNADRQKQKQEVIFNAPQ